MKRNMAFGASVVFAACLMSCSDPDAIPDAIVEPEAPPFSALIDGVAWKSTAGSASGTATSSGMFTVTAFDSTRAVPVGIVLYLHNIAKPGSYTMGAGPTVVGGEIRVIEGKDTVLRTPHSGNAGTIVLTHVSPSRLAGTFFATFRLLVRGDEQIGSTRTVTEASFDVPIAGSGPIEIPVNQGSSMVGNVGNKSFRAGTVNAQLRNNGVLEISGNNINYQISSSINFTGPGTYQMGPPEIGGVKIKTHDDDWGPNSTLVSGTVHISSITESRVTGAIDVIALPGPGSLHKGPLKVGVTFDAALTPP